MLDFDRFQWLSFDCYGTLVDWETGISDAVADSLVSHDIRMSQIGDSGSICGGRTTDTAGW